MMPSTITSAPAPAFDAPSSLLWSYELHRQNRTLTNYLKEVKGEVNASDQRALSFEKCLGDLIVIVASLANVMSTKTEHESQRLRTLRSQLQCALVPLHEYGQALMHKDTTLVTCIAELESLYRMNSGITLKFSVPAYTPANLCRERRGANTAASLSIARSPLVESRHASHDASEDQRIPQQIPTAIPTATVPATDLATAMKQHGRSLDDYFDAASDYYRQQRHLKQASEKPFIKAFIAGCEDNLYRRRLTHALRKNEMTWAWLTHEVHFLVLEEEYMEKQTYALAHQYEDGSVSWPDGSRRSRFVALSPVTDGDLTTSEEE